MKINKLNEISFDTDLTIVAATLTASAEMILLLSSGNVIKYRIKEQDSEHLFSVKSSFSFEDGGFDLAAKSSIYTLDSIVVVVNDYKRHGYIHYPGKYHSVHLWREDYYADISCYPIALYKDEKGVPHIIYSVAWNHVQIMNLDTLQILTAAKSLIEEHAEERHIEYYSKYKEENKHPWPSRYDYFYGKLLLSPDSKSFLSAGWVWGSYDAYRIYNIADFIANSRIADTETGSWEHENRAVCWIDPTTVTVLYNPYMEGEDDATSASASEIHFYKIDGRKAELERKVYIGDLNISHSDMYYDAKLNSIVVMSDHIGLMVFSLQGKVLLKDNDFKGCSYNTETGLLLKVEKQMVSVYEIGS